MRRNRSGRATTIAAALATSFAVTSLASTGAPPAQADELVTVYASGFDGAAGAEWSNTTVSTTPTGRQFLGRFAGESATLSVPDAGIPAGTAITVAFDLFVIDSWDGNGDYCCGPDTFGLRANGDELLMTTFSNTGWAGNLQAYPDAFPGGSHPAYTGAAEVNSLGYDFSSAYRIERSFVHEGGPLSIEFVGDSNQELWDESWGLDNVVVTAERAQPSLTAKPAVRAATADTTLAAELSARLTSLSGLPIADQEIRFEASGAPLCTARTDGDGVATCTGVGEVAAVALGGGYRAILDETTFLFGTEAAGAIAQVTDATL